jgi:hypothetical protein
MDMQNHMNTILRNNKLIFALVGLALVALCLKNPQVSSQYISNIVTWFLKNITDLLLHIFP